MRESGAQLRVRRLRLFGYVVRNDEARIWETLSVLKYRDANQLEDLGRLGGKICRRTLQDEQALDINQWRTITDHLAS